MRLCLLNGDSIVKRNNDRKALTIISKPMQHLISNNGVSLINIYVFIRLTPLLRNLMMR